MRHFRRGAHVRIKAEALPNGQECEGSLLRLSPDRRTAIVRIDLDHSRLGDKSGTILETELLIETRFIEEINETKPNADGSAHTTGF